ncbi:MAG: hypothetical protein Q4B58_05345 [Bacteroidales bacterium]|nr:hypothetical protein [Bacteroidales bacterium]
MDSFSKEALAKLQVSCNKYYVYRLIDPRTFETFYVGKGCDNRVFQHAKEVDELIKKGGTKEKEDELSLKAQQIKDIINAGKEVICLIHRWGLTEDEAFEVEAALIDVYPGLTNIQSGHGSDYGVITAEDFEKLANITEYDEPEEDYIIIKTSQEAVNKAGSLYEATRSSWRANLDKASKYKYVLSVINGMVKEVYTVDETNGWVKQGDRIAFNGTECKVDSLLALKGKLIPAKYRQRGAAYPFMYKKQ